MPIGAVTTGWADCENWDGSAECHNSIYIEYDPMMNALDESAVEEWLSENGWLYLGNGHCLCPVCRFLVHD